MFISYFSSFNLKFDGRVNRRKFWTIIIIDLTLFTIMGYKLYLLNYPEKILFSTFVRSVYVFFKTYRMWIYLICAYWVFARFAAWQALGVRRLHDVGLEDKWLLVPFYNKLSLFKKGTSGKNKYGDNPCKDCKT